MFLIWMHYGVTLRILFWCSDIEWLDLQIPTWTLLCDLPVMLLNCYITCLFVNQLSSVVFAIVGIVFTGQDNL